MILQAIGGVGAWVGQPRMVAQVALLTWWDAVVSLVNRTPCVFPYEYFEAALNCDDDPGWTLYDLCGCPKSLAVPLVQLAHLAAEKQRSSSMRWVSFDDTLVTEIEQSLEKWEHTPSDDASDDEEGMHEDTDQMHCSEAWRYGLLLYIYRVFRWQIGEAPPVKLARRARTVLDHVFACRDGHFVGRQALLPLFFAGCELTDNSSRGSIRYLCNMWNERTRYHLFAAMIPLLEEVWAQQINSGFQDVWWGQTIDQMNSTHLKQALPTCICFG